MHLTLKHEISTETGLAFLWVSQPEKPVVVLDSWLLRQINLFLDFIDPGCLQSSNPIRGFTLLSSSDRVFIAGADLNEINALDDAGLDAYLAFGQSVFNRIESLPFPTVACINGDALGGGLEICLAFRYRIAARPVKRPYQIGLPEAKLGILPGWGGTQRLAAVTHPGHALGRTTTGRSFTPSAALRYGILDAIVPGDHLRQAAIDLIKADPRPLAPRTIQQRSQVVSASLRRARSLRGRPVRRLPAAVRVLDAVEIGLAQGLDSGLAAERKFLIELRKTPECAGQMGAFFSRGGAVRQMTKGIKDAALPTERVTIVGDSDVAEYLACSLGVKTAITRCSVDSLSSDAHVYVEAVGGGQDRRHDQVAVMRAISAIAPDTALLVTTSPILGLNEVAASTTCPERLLGLVPARPLRKNLAIEVISHTKTSPPAIAACANLVRMLGSVPIVQRMGGPTLLVRLFGAVALKAVELARLSRDPASVDRHARAEGFAMGPLRVLDAIGLQFAASVIGRHVVPQDLPAIYTRGSSPVPHRQFLSNCGPDFRTLDDDASTFATTALRMAAAEALTDGICDSPEVIWHAAVFGMGLGAWRFDVVSSLRRQ